ncbi:hypothetical protein T484DRAFT_1884754, partial [Baffinella frigidus]
MGKVDWWRVRTGAGNLAVACALAGGVPEALAGAGGGAEAGAGEVLLRVTRLCYDPRHEVRAMGVRGARAALLSLPLSEATPGVASEEAAEACAGGGCRLAPLAAEGGGGEGGGAAGEG